MRVNDALEIFCFGIMISFVPVASEAPQRQRRDNEGSSYRGAARELATRLSRRFVLVCVLHRPRHQRSAGSVPFVCRRHASPQLFVAFDTTAT